MANKVVLKNLILVTFFHTGSNNIYIYICKQFTKLTARIDNAHCYMPVLCLHCLKLDVK